jgi:hypothetical protein
MKILHENNRFFLPTACFTRTVWLHRSYLHIIPCVISQFLCVAVKHFMRSDEIIKCESVCVRNLALGIRYENHIFLRRIITSSVAHLAMSYFSTLYHTFYENPSSGNLVVPCGRTKRQTDRQKNRRDEANSYSRQFCERA